MEKTRNDFKVKEQEIQKIRYKLVSTKYFIADKTVGNN